MSADKYWLDQVDSDNLHQIAYAEALQKKASEVGFDWPYIDGIVSKIKEEIDELNEEIDKGTDKTKLEAEMGDLLFACVNLARHLEIDPDTALSLSNEKFYSRFQYIEDKLSSEGKTLQDTSLSYMDELWDEAKDKEA